MKQNQFEFKPFDKILVRDADEALWKANFFSHINKNKYTDNQYCCVTGNWSQCIPYNEETQCLIGTNKPYQPKKKEIKYEVTFGFGNDLTVKSYTEEEFRRFINIAVINNKDIKDFSVNIIIPD